MKIKRIFHLQFGTDGRTERFFLRLTDAFARRGIEQGFAIRPDFAWRERTAALGWVIEGRMLRRTPAAAIRHLWMSRALRRWQPDAILAWRAPAARLIPSIEKAAKLVRLGDYPSHIRHFRDLDCVIGIAPKVLEHVEQIGWRGRKSLIANFPPDQTTMPIARSQLATPEDAFVVSAAGRFTNSKAFDTLISAIARTPGAWLWLIGDGPDRRALTELVETEGIANRVRMPGWVSSPMDFVRSSDVFCVPSRQEPLGNVLLEGWKSGIPMVATRAEGASWAATNEVDTLLVDIDDVGAMSTAFGRLRSDPDLGKVLTGGARAVLGARFSEQKIVDEYLNLIEDIQETAAP